MRQQALRTGFTLVELLVVIAILSVLAGLLLPALQGALQAAGVASCQSEMRQTYAAIAMYDNDFGDTPYQYQHGGHHLWSHAGYRWFLEAYLEAEPQGVGGACPTVRDRMGGGNAIGYFYFGCHTYGRPGTQRAAAAGGGTYDDRRPARPLHLLQRMARRARERKPDQMDGKYLLLADRINIIEKGQAYDMGPPKEVVHQTYATAHVATGGPAGSNLLWADGSCQWRPLDPAWNAAPPPTQHYMTGNDGFIREDNSPYSDVLMPVESIAVGYANLHGAICRPIGYGHTGNEYVTLER